MRQTLVLDVLQEIISEERFDSRVLERLVVRVLNFQFFHTLVGQEAGSEVRGAGLCFHRLLGAIRFGGWRGMVGGIVRDLLPLVLRRRVRSRSAFSIHEGISEAKGK